MNLDIDAEQVLGEPDLLAIERRLEDFAQDIALLGDIDSARELISALLAAPPLSSNTLARYLLVFAWKETGNLPDSISQISYEDELKAARKRYDNDWPGIDEEHRTFDEAGLQACMADAKTTKQWSTAREAPLVKALDISLRLQHRKSAETDQDEREPKRRKVESSTTADQESGLSAADPKIAELLKLVKDRWNLPGLRDNLCSAEQLWPHYKTGLLAGAFGLTIEQVKAKGQIILETYVKRLHSHPRPFTTKTTHELVQLANNNTIKHSSLDFWPDQVVPKSLMHVPATDTEIAALEERLGSTLPDDFKEFLRITNGFGVGDQGIFNRVFPQPNLRSTEDIKLKIFDDELMQSSIELLSLLLDIVYLVESEHPLLEMPFPPPDKIIELGQTDVDMIWLIPPETTKATVSVYRRIHEACDTEQKRVVDRAVEAFAGSWEELEKLEWVCVSGDQSSPPLPCYTSFRQYLEMRAFRSEKPYKG